MAARRFFNAVRDTVTDKFVMTYKAGEPKPDSARQQPAAPGTPPDQSKAQASVARSGMMAGHPHRRPGPPDAGQDRALHLRRHSPTPALAGDTLASALLANGVHLVGRSFKYHRPRGILSAGAEEPNALVDGRARRRPQDAERARHRAGAL